MVYHRPHLRHDQIIDQIAARNSNFHHIRSRSRSSSSASDDGSRYTILLNYSATWSLWNSIAAAADRFCSERRSCLKASATFLSSLRSNLIIDCSAPNHHAELYTPIAMSSPAADEASSTEPPALSTYTTTDADERKAALRLIADSVAQQRQTAARALVSHPIHLAVALALLAYTYQAMLSNPRYGLGVALSTLSGLAMLLLVTVRKLTHGYILAAERVHEDLFDNAEVVVAKFGDEIISAAVWGWADAGARRKPKRAIVRAWTTRLKYRGKGAGTGVLEVVCDEVRKRGGEDVEFADVHVNSTRVLWDSYNGPFEKRDQRARKCLEQTWEVKGAKRKRSRSRGQ